MTNSSINTKVQGFPDPYLNFEQTREYLGDLPASTLRQYTAERKITSYRPGKKVLYRQSDLDAFMAKHIKRSHDRINDELDQKRREANE
ncbi:helix-turn-helix domain-containing protein [Hymenobacter sp. BT491]|uniref:helix-turn-helix domain-containing protein n=1 Tax=Hymenobacter sp. BT491 TaxID=2766779 RepID=UPI001653BD93|nr:helix-turn-helix domain-containing protein [Hymenobacter sp. BT491]MBC6992275.1 helix-turn-helix domain-containing protein [Hymenobacter sp. BT491]